MVEKNSSWVWIHFTWICLLATLGCQSAEAASKTSSQLKPGSVCTLQGNLNIRNKAQKRNIKITALSQGDTFEIVRYHRVWVRIRVEGKIAFAAPQGLKKLCTPKPVQTEPVPKQAPVPADAPDNPVVLPAPTEPEPPVETPAIAQTQPNVQESPADPAKVKPPAEEPAPQPVEEKPAPEPIKAKTTKAAAVKIADLPPMTEETEAHISPGAWVALGAGAAGIGAAAYFVTQLTEQDEAKTGQYALITGTAGLMAVVIGFSYILYPELRTKAPNPKDSEAMSTQILLGPNSIGLAGEF